MRCLPLDSLPRLSDVFESVRLEILQHEDLNGEDKIQYCQNTTLLSILSDNFGLAGLLTEQTLLFVFFL